MQTPTKKSQVISYFVNNPEPQTYDAVYGYFALLSWDNPGQIPTYMSHVSRLIRSGAVVKTRNPKDLKQTILVTSEKFRLKNYSFVEA